jgi:hypothetical protein
MDAVQDRTGLDGLQLQVQPDGRWCLRNLSKTQMENLLDDLSSKPMCTRAGRWDWTRAMLLMSSGAAIYWAALRFAAWWSG